MDRLGNLVQSSSMWREAYSFTSPIPAARLRTELHSRFGRRLSRDYGWHGGQFELAEKMST